MQTYFILQIWHFIVSGLIINHSSNQYLTFLVLNLFLET